MKSRIHFGDWLNGVVAPPIVLRSVGALGLVAALALVAGCQKGGGGPPLAPVNVETIRVSTAPVEDRLGAIGSIQANETVELKPEAPGRIKGIHFQEGQRVAAGAMLFELDADKEAAQLAQASADLELARQNEARAQTLSGTRAISKQEIDQIRGQVAFREAVQTFQQERVADMKLAAPFDGVLGPRTVSLGQFVNVGTILVTLTDDSRMKVIYRVPERHLADVKVGQPVTVQVAAYPDRVFPGTVDLVNPQVDLATRTMEVRAIAPNPDRLLKSGMFTRVETVTGRRPAAIVVPETSVVPSLTGFSVYLVQSNLARMTPVQIGMRLPGAIEIRSGIEVGQELIVAGTQKIADGSLVQPAPAKSTIGTNGLRTASVTR